MSDDDNLDRLVRNYRQLTQPQYTRLQERAAARAKALRAEFLRKLLARLFAWRRRRAAIAELNALDDQTLKDIGLHRSEIEAAVRRDIPARLADAGVTLRPAGRSASQKSRICTGYGAGEISGRGIIASGLG